MYDYVYTDKSVNQAQFSFDKQKSQEASRTIITNHRSTQIFNAYNLT